MLYGMAKDEPYLRGKIQKAILLAPCTIPSKDSKPPGALEIYSAKVDVYEFSGSNWSDEKQKACTVTKSATCEAMDFYDDLQPTSVLSNVHKAQMSEVAAFQELVEAWPNKRDSNLIDLEAFDSFPISYHVAQFDKICEPWYSEPLKNTTELRVDSLYTLYTNEIGHDLFAFSSNITSNYSLEIATEIEIESGRAKALKTQGRAFLTRSGGYYNPADDSLKDSAQGALLLSYFTFALAIQASLF